MQKFTLAGREWTWPKMTTRTVNLIRDKYALDLRGLIRQDAALALALADDGKLFDVFAGLCGQQIKESGLAREDLEDQCDEAGVASLRESLCEGFFALCLGRTKAREAVANMREALGGISTSNG